MAKVIRKKQWRDTRTAFERAAQTQVRYAGMLLLNTMRNNFGSGDGPENQTGSYRRSIKMTRKGLRSKTRPRVLVGPRIWYAPVQEYGGELKAKKGYLTIPLNRTARSIAKKKAFRQHKLITIRSKAGNLIMGRKTAKRKDFRPLFVLKKSVHLRARPFVRPTLARMRTQLRNMLSRTAIVHRAEMIAKGGSQ